ncbi:PP2C family protein-serine/threonine phosphatase [Propioniciclava soli]|uniref:Protein phosphatase 2C domain-containing protein n=1 Tax=Propioniciclava soli TaxID=2775081 RepID=A0ABZ3C4Q4_9ACTN|nr:protein phosphatase 2C domain-containing protein [Propioniciclava soli]
MLTIRSAHATDVGRVRRLNEDNAFAGQRLWVVADGMGGHAAGDVASRLVIEELRTLDAQGDLRPADLVAGITRANGAVVAHGRRHDDARGLGTTVTGVAVVTVAGEPHWAIFNVGDSRVYRAAAGQLARATIDHSETEELVLEGVITPEEARTHRARNVITRSLGMPGEPQVDLWLLPQTPGERFLVCSDGLNSELDDLVIADVLATHPDAEPAARALVDAAVRHGGRDNVTAIVVNVEGEWDTADDDTQPRDRGPATSASDGEER